MLFQVDCLSPLYFVILLEFHTFIWNVFLYHLILPNFLCLWSPFLRIQHCDSSWFSHPFVGEDDSGACAGFPVGGTGACPLLGEAGYCPSGVNTVSRHLFRDNYWLKTTLGSLSASDMVCVFSVRSSLGNAGNWEELGVRFRCRPSWGILWWPMILDSELKP